MREKCNKLDAIFSMKEMAEFQQFDEMNWKSRKIINSEKIWQNIINKTNNNNDKV